MMTWENVFIALLYEEAFGSLDQSVLWFPARFNQGYLMAFNQNRWISINGGDWRGAFLRDAGAGLKRPISRKGMNHFQNFTLCVLCFSTSLLHIFKFLQVFKLFYSIERKSLLFLKAFSSSNYRGNVAFRSIFSALVCASLLYAFRSA
ncbi:hypothetical protein L195_g028319 [Trifolium pratense]|uniref:Uncharacterized protein n=1 Tax=Trifolium pratense TaxID=57577 RepID=A0A2K3L1M8_TRIPR|nr:hypothetical protein L195_g028319 [Trifolium pratense]